MIEPRIGNLLIKDFRSLKGTVSIPFDAPIVLLHGSNGMGKTSILSALELVFTGQIEHLARVDANYGTHLLRRDADSGSITITNDHQTALIAASGEVVLNKSGFSGQPLLTPEGAKFFSERCYLPQSLLGRLLEIYQDPSGADKTTQLTRFVNDLLGLDQLDALIDGLHASLNVTRIRNLIPEFRRFENRASELQQTIAELRTQAQQESEIIRRGLGECQRLVQQLYPPNDPMHSLIREPVALSDHINRDDRAARAIENLAPARQELQSLRTRWHRLPQTLSSRERADRERADRKARDDYAQWLATTGARLDSVRQRLLEVFPTLPSPTTGDPEKFRRSALESITAERDRLNTLLQLSKDASKQIGDIEFVVRQANSRIVEIDAELKRLSSDTSSLAQALVGVAPHIHGDNCPVCSRNFAEVRSGPLAAHLAATIATLTSQAGRLRTLTNSKIEEAGRISANERQRPAFKRNELSQQQFAANSLRKAMMDEAVAELNALSAASVRGAELQRQQNATRMALAQTSSRDQAIDAIQSDLQRWTIDYDQAPVDSNLALGDAIGALVERLSNEISELQFREQGRQYLLNRLREVIDHTNRLAKVNEQREEGERQASIFRATERRIASLRSDAKMVSQAAADARASIVGRVFNTSLNRVWRDLFVRLAPAELFVPAFKLPADGKRAIDAQLHTVHRVDGTAGGPPGTMLSAGNLNTAALTLFLALHLSVKKNLPWLILDDPVQSMDDLHIAQFAALLRMISKGLGRQVVLAVHDRALFDYLVLELSPSFEGDRLITVELSRTGDGTAIATPTVLMFEKDTAIAA